MYRELPSLAIIAVVFHTDAKPNRYRIGTIYRHYIGIGIGCDIPTRHQIGNVSVRSYRHRYRSFAGVIVPIHYQFGDASGYRNQYQSQYDFGIFYQNIPFGVVCFGVFLPKMTWYIIGKYYRKWATVKLLTIMRCALLACTS